MSIEDRLQEIRQIMVQYKAEVGSKRRSWPESIKKRVFALVAQGHTMKSVSDETGIPYHTIIQWRQEQMREGKFHSVAIRGEEKTVTTVTVPTKLPEPTGTVTVTTPDGYRIEADNYQTAIQLIQQLRRGH